MSESTVFTDAFGTAYSADSWGPNWTIGEFSSANLSHSVTGGWGVMTQTATNNLSFYQYSRPVLANTMADAEFAITVKTSVLLPRATCSIYVAATSPAAQFITNTNAAVWVEFHTGGSSSPTLYARGTSGTVLSQSLGLSISSLNNSSGWKVRVRRDGNTAYAKMWLATDTEPGTWTATLNISSLTIPAGVIGINRDTNSTSSTSVGTFSVDNASVIEIVNTSIPGGYTAQPMTSSALMVDPSVGVGKTYTAQAMTASALMPADSTGYGNVIKRYITDDVNVDVNFATSNFANDTTFNPRSVAGNYALIKPAPIGITLGGGLELVDTKLVITRLNSASQTTMGIYRITSDWVENTVTWNTKPTMTFVKNVVIPAGGANAVIELDVADVLSTTNYGIALASDNSGSHAFLSSEYSSNQPYMKYTTAQQGNGGYTAQPMTASALMPESTTTATSTVSIGSTPMTAAATMAPGDVYIVSGTLVLADAMTAFAEITSNNVFAITVSQTADVMTAAGSMVDPDVDTQVGVVFNAPALTANAMAKQPSAVNGAAIIENELDDKFFVRVMESTPTYWYRLNDTGALATNRMNPAGPKGNYVGVTTGQFNGPDGRHSVYFDGNAYIKQNEGGSEEFSTPINTVEFSIRTNKSNQFIMASNDERAGSVSNTPLGVRELFLKNGKIGYRYYGSANPNVPVEFVGFKNIADGNWHRIAVVSNQTNNDSTNGVSIYIDGQLEIRRSTAVQWTGFPDYIGSRPLAFLTSGPWAGTTMLNAAQSFVGDMSEVVFNATMLSKEDITRRYYDFMAWNPIEVDPIEAFAFMTDGNKGTGNRKRVLYLWWFPTTDGVSANLGGNGKMNFDPSLQTGTANSLKGKTGTFQIDDSIVDAMAINGGYRDPVTDLPSFIDLTYHVDISNYDSIWFGDWPDEGYEEDALQGISGGFFPAKEKFISQLRTVNDAGVGLLVTHPRMAVDLGIINRVEYVPNLIGGLSNPGLQGNAGGLYDYGSAAKFPWNITADAGLIGAGNAGAIGTGVTMNVDPAYLDFKALFYEDHNYVNKFRVRATISGLTDIPSYMMKDAIKHVDRDVWGETLVAWDLVDRRGGLVIGDEFIFNGTNPAEQDWEPSSSIAQFGRPFGYYAVPIANVKAGTVVTTFGATHWQNRAEVENPYKDYATTIALDRGDVLAGRPVGGRIFVSFTEAPYMLKQSFQVDIIPGSTWDDGTAVWPNGYTPDTAAQREWDLSMTRATATNTTINGKVVETQVIMPDGSISVTRAAGDGLVMSTLNLLFRRAAVGRWDMTRRGLWWVARGTKPVAGEKRVAAEAMTATATMVQPVVVAQKDGGYKAQPMVALAQMTKAAEDSTGDVDIYTLPMTASAEMTGYSKRVMAEPMTAHAEMVENFDMVHATGEQVVLTLHGVDATLYLKEEA